MGETSWANGDRRGIEYVPFIILAHPQFQLRAQIVQVILIETDKAKDLFLGMGMRLAAPMPALV